MTLSPAVHRGIRAHAADVGDADTFDDIVDQVRGVLQDWDSEPFDFLVNNAGMGVHASIAETTEEQFDRLMDIHVKGPFFLTQKLLPLMADGGRIVNVSTGLARITLPGSAAYASAKGASDNRQRDYAGCDRDRLQGRCATTRT